jgi:Protein involved in initiation of plasmid replication
MIDHLERRYSLIIPRNERILHMDELMNRKAVEHNDLVSSVAKMDKTPLKIFELAVSCIDTDNPPKDETIYLSKTELFSFFDVSSENKHSRFKKAIETMQHQAFFEIREEQGRGLEYRSIVPIPEVAWNSYNDEVKIRFDRAIMPYLIDLKKNFTQYAISEIMDLNGKYSIILYKWLVMNYNQFEHYQYKNERTQAQLDELRNPKISVKELRVLTDTATDYSRFGNFETKVLKQPLEEINANTQYNVSYEKIKKGRSIADIIFHIEKKKVAKDENYKERQQDPVYLENKEEKEQNKALFFQKAMQSEYTTLLGEYMLIGFKDMQDIELMGDLQRLVYPLYDELRELRGLDEVRKHLSYVARKQEGYSKSNIAKYLKIAIEQYLGAVKFQ